LEATVCGTDALNRAQPSERALWDCLDRGRDLECHSDEQAERHDQCASGEQRAAPPAREEEHGGNKAGREQACAQDERADRIVAEQGPDECRCYGAERQPACAWHG
jgi:hypothetical protein